jgi:hypothetical protein
MNPPITCAWPQVAGQIRTGAGINNADPINWQCGTPTSVYTGIAYGCFAGAALALFFLPGALKIIALPAGVIGFNYWLKTTGGF